MRQHITQLNDPPVIGQIYIVPTITHLEVDDLEELPRDIPVLLPGHIDNFNGQPGPHHYHVDHRFSSEKVYKHMGLDWDSYVHELDKQFKDVKIKTKKDCRVCPHQKIKLDSFIKEDQGSIRCPGHGLNWNLKTGELIPDKQGKYIRGPSQ